MNIISISYKTAPVKIREMFAFSIEEQERFLSKILCSEHITECVLVSTCNRSEVYFNGDRHAVEEMQQNLAEFKKADIDELKKHFLVFCDEMAIRHLFRVACGLDSMVIGEDEILGQIKDAYDLALGLGTTKYLLNTLFQAAITCAKKIKTDTLLSKIPVSIGTLVANEVLQFPKESKKVLIIGLTGKMGSIIMKNLYKKLGLEIVGTSRSHNAIQLCSIPSKVKVVDYKDRYRYMDEADIIISATTSPHYTITHHELEQSIRQDKDRLFIDVAVPTDIDKDVTRIMNTKLFDIDYFKEASQNNTQVKEKETFRAQLMIEEHLEEVQKELTFHNFLSDLPKVKKVMEERNFESIMYGMKEKATSTELATVLDLLRKLI